MTPHLVPFVSDAGAAGPRSRVERCVMAGSRLPGPQGRDEPSGPPGVDRDVLGGGFEPLPVGLDVPLQAPAPSKPTAGSGIELNLVGQFPNPWSTAQEPSQVAAKKWFPNTPDFKAVAGTGSIEISSAWDFLLKVLQAKGTISRLNFFSHGNKSLIAMEGQTKLDGKDVDLALTGKDGKWVAAVTNVRAILDPYAATGPWGTFGEKSSQTFTVGTTTVSLASVRAKFDAKAEIWLYICHAAFDVVLLQQVANTFQVTAKGFSGEIVYCVPATFPTSRKHKLFVNDHPPSDPCANIAEADFHAVANHGNVVTMTPKAPP
jgi:hypothetical protein